MVSRNQQYRLLYTGCFKKVSIKNLYCDPLITLINGFQISLDLVDLYILFDISFIRFGFL